MKSDQIKKSKIIIEEPGLLSTIQGLVDFTARLKNPYTKQRGVGIRLSE